ncbi:MAG: hypothetical protein ACI9U2_004164 [Bradymonadia bacterium]|jgi:hypothetical protein
MTRMIARIVALGALSSAALTSNAWAEPPPPELEAAPVEKANSVNLSPIGVVSGTYALNYERLFGGTHGLLVEAVFISSDDGDTNSTSLGGQVGYRWHWNGTQNSWFNGVNFGYTSGTGEAVVESTSNGSTTKSKFDVDVSVFTATLNIGRRWAWDSGFNITFRAGAGYGNYDVSTDSDDVLAQEAVQLVDDLLTLLPIAVDGELSIGWNF